eukprot:728014-Prymnesium_polylepis.1
MLRMYHESSLRSAVQNTAVADCLCGDSSRGSPQVECWVRVTTLSVSVLPTLNVRGSLGDCPARCTEEAPLIQLDNSTGSCH